jgi:hypothetical protein
MKHCSVCRLPQFETPHGLTCDNGHGGAPSIEDDSQSEPVSFASHEDDPELDCTPFQSAAFSRGETNAVENVVQRINDILDGNDPGIGVFGNENLEKLRRRLLKLHPPLSKDEIHG